MSGIKKQIKNTVFFSMYKKLQGKKELNSISNIINNEFRYSSNMVPESRDSIYGKIRLRIHSYEKALVKNMVPNLDSLLTLFPLAQRLLDAYPDYPKNADAVVETVGIALSVIQANKTKGADCTKVENALDSFIKANQLEAVQPRVINIAHIAQQDRPNDVHEQYEQFVKERHSVRQYTKEPIDPDVIRKIVATAQICPSACNRQPCKVYYTNEPEKMRDLFPDKSVTKDVYNLLVVTTNRSFYSAKELFQPYVDGGIFIQSLVMAIHAYGLGACLFQYLKSNVNYQEFKNRAGIPVNEDILCCVGFGKLAEEYDVIETHRKNVEEMIVEY